MRQWVRGSAAGTALIAAGLLVGASAFAAPVEDTIDFPIDFTINPTDELTEEPTDDPTIDLTDDPTEEPTEDPDPTEDPTEDPTDDPTEDPTDDPTEEPTEEPTDEPTEDPTDDPTDDPEPTEPPTTSPTTGEEVSPGEGLPGQPITGGAPTFAAIPPITAATRADVTEADLMAGIHVSDDLDMRLVPMISDWGDWHSPQECPAGYPCTYRIVYLVFDNDDNFAEGTRDVIITGRQSSAIGASLGGVGQHLLNSGIFDREEPVSELPWTGIDTEHLLIFGGLLVAGGTGLIYSARKTAIR